MSPSTPSRAARPASSALANRIASTVSLALAEERRRRGWTIRDVAARAGVAPATVHAVEAGRRASIDVYARVAVALGLGIDVTVAAARGARTRQNGDLVHAAMGEWEATLLARPGHEVAIDHPYQHYQFAGRADVLAWRREPPSLLHIENRTRFPDIQEAAGSFNAKCLYLAPVLARQLGLRAFRSVTHVMVCLWPSGVIHALRLHPATFRALAPDSDEPFAAWFRGEPPAAGDSRSLVLLDPFVHGLQRATISLDAALGLARPRMRGYREAADRLRAWGSA